MQILEKLTQEEGANEQDVEMAFQLIYQKAESKDAKGASTWLKETGVDDLDAVVGSVDDREGDAATALEIEQLRLKEKAIGLEDSEQKRLNELTSTEAVAKAPVKKAAPVKDAEEDSFSR